MNRPYQVIIDTNVLVSAIRSKNGASHKLLLLLGEDKRWQLNLSNQLFLEYLEKVHKHGSSLGYEKQGLDDFLDYICSVAVERKTFFSWRPFLPDPEDEFILDLAIASNADYIITYNKRDFVGVSGFGISVLTPLEFLKVLGELK